MQDNCVTTYAAYARDELLRLSSSSGAVFSLLAEQILYKDGVVYGVALSSDCKSAEYIRVDHLEDLFQLRGSKYLQAKVGSAYNQVKLDLEAGINVLFSGVGCQINGLKTFLHRTYQNLFCVDVICHGVPSPMLWTKYVEHMEKQNGAKLVSVNFRCKNEGWQNFGMKELDENRKVIYIPKAKDPFMQMFLKNYCLRPSCYECVAKNVKMSDITIADFWGIERVAPDMNDGKGTSLVLIRSEKGAELFGQISNRLIYKEVSYEEGVLENPSEYKSVNRPKERDAFFQDMNELEFNNLQKKYVASVKKSVVQTAKGRIKKVFSKIHNCICFMKRFLISKQIFGGGG